MAMIYDTSLFNLAMQQNKQAWEGIAEARKSAVQTTHGNLQALVDRRTAQSEMLGSFAKGFSPVFGNLGKKLGGSFFPGGGGSDQIGPAGWAQTQSGQNVWGDTGIEMSAFDRLVGGAGGTTPMGALYGQR